METPAIWPESDDLLHVSHQADRCSVLGPGCRAVVWVQGCPFRCPGCVAPQTQPFAGGSTVEVETLAHHLAALRDIEGVTLSGGEPMCQAAALARLVAVVREQRDLTFMAYSGYTLEWLQERGTAAQRAFISELDLLIDGPYVAEQHTDLLWRGSANQRVHFLSDRYAHLAAEVDGKGTSIEFSLGTDGSVYWMGIPPPGFRDALPAALRDIGITLREGDAQNEWFA